MPKERTPGLTAVSISITIDALGRIDARAAQLGLSRSAYMSLMSLQGPTNTVIKVPHDTQSPLRPQSADPATPADSQPAQAPSATLDFTTEVYDFLLIAIPALQEYEASRNNGDPNPGDPTVEIPDDVADSKLWRFFMIEREEILRLKWIESQKLGRDIGLNRAILIWLQLHRALWIAGQTAET